MVSSAALVSMCAPSRAMRRAGMGHAEPAAGVAGLLALAAALESRRTAPMLHLRSLNPLVTSILSGRDGEGRLCAQMPRAEAMAGGTNGQHRGESYQSVSPLCLVLRAHAWRVTCNNASETCCLTRLIDDMPVLFRWGQRIRLPRHQCARRAVSQA